MGLYMDEIEIQARKNDFLLKFRKTFFCNRFLRAWGVQYQREHNAKKNSKTFLRSRTKSFLRSILLDFFYDRQFI